MSLAQPVLLSFLPGLPMPSLLLCAAQSPLNQVSVRGGRWQKMRSRRMILRPAVSISLPIRLAIRMDLHGYSIYHKLKRFALLS